MHLLYICGGLKKDANEKDRGGIVCGIEYMFSYFFLNNLDH